MLIGICGFQSSGKDTAAELLINEYGFIKLSFASALKDVLSVIFGWDRSKLEGLTQEDRQWREIVDPWWSQSLKMPQLTPRYVLQYFGTDLFRNHWHPDIWVKVIENKIVRLLESYDNPKIVITDCRFENEINLILRYGGKMMHMHRNLPGWFKDYQRGINSPEAERLHTSEVMWIRTYADHVIENNGTIEELYDKIKYIIDKTT
jgi:hypothetical protein